MKYAFLDETKLSEKEIEEKLLELTNGTMANIIQVPVHFTTDLITIQPQANGNWIDVMNAEDVSLMTTRPPFGGFKISLGFSMKIPKGYEAHLAPRSSTYQRYGLIQTNGIGIVDESYSGTKDIWMLPVCQLQAPKVNEIPRGTRIAQFRFVASMEKEMFTAPNPATYYNEPTIAFMIRDTLDGPDRGGFGSTGI